MWAIPRSGARLAELIVLPVVLLVVAVAKRWIVDRVAAPPSLPRRLGMSGFAFALLLLTELMIVPVLRDLQLTSYFADSGAI